MYKIVRREVFTPTTFLWDVEARDVSKVAQPGHFVMLRLREGSERIPLTVADYDRDRGTITLVVQALGKTTRDMMANFQEGDSFLDFVGPLGQAQHVEKVGHVVVVGGGLGVAPVYPQLRAFKHAGNRTTSIIGFRSQDLVFWEDRFKKHSDTLLVCTDDGSYGRKGFVTDALKEVLEKEKPDLVVAIGPLPMMHACVETSRPFGVKTMVSLNAIMVDGTGMCGSCRVTVAGQVKLMRWVDSSSRLTSVNQRWSSRPASKRSGAKRRVSSASAAGFSDCVPAARSGSGSQHEARNSTTPPSDSGRSSVSMSPACSLCAAVSAAVR